MIYHTCINVFGTCYSAPNICSSLPGGGKIGPGVRIMITKRKIAIRDERNRDERDRGDGEKDQLHHWSFLLNLNARSIDDPAEPVNCPLRPKNDVAPLPLLTADPVK